MPIREAWDLERFVDAEEKEKKKAQKCHSGKETRRS
jgi:hypothetical protein